MDRESVIPLVFGAVLTLIVHSTALPIFSHLILTPSATKREMQMNRPSRSPPMEEHEPKREELEEPQIPIGSDETSSPTSIAWISHEDFQELLGPKSPSPQPALQRLVDPVSQAPVQSEPTPPAPSARPQPIALAQLSTLEAPVDDTPAPPDQTAPTVVEQDLAIEDAEPDDVLASAAETIAPKNAPPSLADVPDLINEANAPAMRQTGQMEPGDASDDPTTKDPADTVTKSADRVVIGTPNDQPDVIATPPKPPQTRDDAAERSVKTPPTRTAQPRPTSATKSDRESDLFAEQDALEVQPGKVLTRRGIEIKTIRPRFSAIAVNFAAPRNPIVMVKFDHKTGMVLSARLVRRSGFPNVDGPVLASLYSWRASGSKLAELKEPFTMRIKITLVQ